MCPRGVTRLSLFSLVHNESEAMKLFRIKPVEGYIFVSIYWLIFNSSFVQSFVNLHYELPQTSSHTTISMPLYTTTILWSIVCTMACCTVWLEA